MAKEGMPLYGTAPGARLASYRVDRVGVHRATVTTPFVERAERFGIGQYEVPELDGLLLVDFGLSDNGKGGFVIEWQFEGAPAGGALNAFGTPDRPLYGFRRARIDISLLAHPEWTKILAKKYGGFEQGGQPVFPEYMPDGSAQAAEGAGGSGKPNDLYGAKTYRVAYGIFFARYTSNVVPPGIWDDVNRVITKPPGIDKIKFRTPKGRNWLKDSPEIQERGNIYEIEEQWELSGPGGHNRDVYSFGQLQ